MGTTTELRREIKSRLVPFLAEQGFAIDQRHAPANLDFRRFLNGQVHCIDIQWEKYGTPRFTINAGAASDRGTKWRDMKTAATDMGPAQCPEYIRLYPGKLRGSTRRWFRQDHTLFKWLTTGQRRKPAAEVIDQVITLYPELDVYLTNGTIGPHCDPSPGSWVDEE
jgi:hypothetical protein